MKKIMIAASLLTIFLAACKKDDPDKVSTLRDVTRPTISFSGGQFYSINTGGSLPTVTATAFDSALGESYPVTIVGTDALDNSTPGLYIVSARSKNKYGFITNENVYVAVTNIPESTDISGEYKRVDVSTGQAAIVTKLARGLYQLDNLGGVIRTGAGARPDLMFPVYFVQADDSTLLIPEQETAIGSIQVEDENGVPNQAILRRSPGDTSYRYAIISGSPFGDAVRTFKKQ
jgi:hypothetical protein